jgi:hypothetical protein
LIRHAMLWGLLVGRTSRTLRSDGCFGLHCNLLVTDR